MLPISAVWSAVDDAGITACTLGADRQGTKASPATNSEPIARGSGPMDGISMDRWIDKAVQGRLRVLPSTCRGYLQNSCRHVVGDLSGNLMSVFPPVERGLLAAIVHFPQTCNCDAWDGVGVYVGYLSFWGRFNVPPTINGVRRQPLRSLVCAVPRGYMYGCCLLV